MNNLNSEPLEEIPRPLLSHRLAFVRKLLNKIADVRNGKLRRVAGGREEGTAAVRHSPRCLCELKGSAAIKQRLSFIKDRALTSNFLSANLRMLREVGNWERW